MNQIEKIIDIATWNRREHYEHFSAFDDPFFGVTVKVDCTRAYQEAKDQRHFLFPARPPPHNDCCGCRGRVPLPHRRRSRWCVMTVFCPKPPWAVPTIPFLLPLLNMIRTNLFYPSGKSRNGTPASHYGTQQRRHVSSQCHSLFGCAVALFHRYEASHQYAFGRQRSQNLHRKVLP